MFEDLSDTKQKNKAKEGKEKKKKKKNATALSRIHVHVIQAEDLPAGDEDGLCDPYCKL